MARAEIPLKQIKPNAKKVTDLEQYVINKLKGVGRK
jgi:hypothetical protein